MSNIMSSSSSSLVPPGNTTGIYYILLSGVERTLDWKQIKDFGRGKGFDIDWVEIYEKNLGGWVRVIGRDNFKLACNAFNTYIFNGKTLQVDTRNEFYFTTLRFPPRTSPKIPRALANSPASTESLLNRHSDSMYSLPIHNQAAAYYDYSSPNYSIDPEHVPFYIAPTEPTPFSGQIPDVNLPNQAQLGHMIPRTGVLIVFRKIVVKKLSPKTTKKGLEELIAWALHAKRFYEGLIEKYEFTIDDKGKHKGTAYVFMVTCHDADLAVARLNGTKHGNRILEVTLATEGAAPMSYTHHQLYEEEETLRSVTPAIVDGSGAHFTGHNVY